MVEHPDNLEILELHAVIAQLVIRPKVDDELADVSEHLTECDECYERLRTYERISSWKQLIAAMWDIVKKESHYSWKLLVCLAGGQFGLHPFRNFSFQLHLVGCEHCRELVQRLMTVFFFCDIIGTMAELSEAEMRDFIALSVGSAIQCEYNGSGHLNECELFAFMSQRTQCLPRLSSKSLGHEVRVFRHIKHCVLCRMKLAAMTREFARLDTLIQEARFTSVPQCPPAELVESLVIRWFAETVSQPRQFLGQQTRYLLHARCCARCRELYRKSVWRESIRELLQKLTDDREHIRWTLGMFHAYEP